MGLGDNLTASGDIFEPFTEYTAASPYLPFGTDLLVTYGGNSGVVEVTDRGPYTGGRNIDLSALAAEELGLTYTGVRLRRRAGPQPRTFAKLLATHESGRGSLAVPVYFCRRQQTNS